MINRQNYHINHLFSDNDITNLNASIGKKITSFRLYDTNRVGFQLVDGLLIGYSNAGGVFLYLQPDDAAWKSERFVALKIEFIPQPWSIFGEYAIPQCSWEIICKNDYNVWFDQHEKKHASNSCLITSKLPEVTEWRIYGAKSNGRRENEGGRFDGDTFNVDIDLLLAFLGSDGQVFCFSFNRYPELDKGVFFGIYPQLSEFEETMAFGENHYGEKIFTLKRSSAQPHVQ